MRSSHRWAGAVLVAGVLLATAGCSGSSDGASPSASKSAGASPSPSPSGTFTDYPKGTFTAQATGAVTGTMKYPGGGGCRIVRNNDPGVLMNVAMGVTVPTKKTAVMVLAVSKAGRNELTKDDPSFMTMFGYGDVWNTQNEGGGGWIDVQDDGHKGTFDVTMPLNAGGTPPLHVVGSFTCP